MNLIIQKKRKELGFTQEQVAEYLNVSTPAVSKWEKGITSPDISLLPSLARFLKIDLNTLFCFSEDISPAEIGSFCQEITKKIQTDGFIAGFHTAKAKLHEYPYNESLLHYTAVLMDGQLMMSGMDEAEKEPFEAEILSWYQKLSQSSEDKISNSAKYMLAGKYIRSEEYEKAQEILDSMPSKEDHLGGMADKLMLQVLIYEKQGKAEQAILELQGALLKAVQKVQVLLNKLVDAELSAKNYENARQIAEKSSQIPALFDLWEYSSFVAPMQVAMAEENATACIDLLNKLLHLISEPWKPAVSPLFYRIQSTKATGNLSQLLPAILTELEKDSQYDFLRENEDFQKLIAKFKKS